MGQPMGIFSNPPLMAALIAWLIAQLVKPPLEYMRKRKWNWALLLRAGGMPSSHSALVAGAAHATGLFEGFASPYFAIAFVVAVVVIYDATGIRRQAGKHARIINQMVNDLATGHPLKQEQLREVLGHTPLEALMGTLLGIATAQITYWIR
ncbi:MAG: divergent PAP2 family protein [Chloroflexota bacterium]